MTDPDWQRGSRCAGEDHCIEVAFADGQILVRNGKTIDGPVLAFTQQEWDAFVAGARDGEFDL